MKASLPPAEGAALAVGIAIATRTMAAGVEGV
jgi:hypothetical protein